MTPPVQLGAYAEAIRESMLGQVRMLKEAAGAEDASPSGHARNTTP